MDDWRARLRMAVDRADVKHAAIAWRAGIAPASLSRILTGAHQQPRFDTIVRIAHACGTTVGWLLNERGFSLSDEQRRTLLAAANLIVDACTVAVTDPPRER